MEPKLSVYFDGLCHLCSREIDHYRKKQGADRLRFVDITDPAFDAAKEKLDPRAIHKEMHVRRADGSIVTGVAAFQAIWEVLPAYHWLARATKPSWMRPFLNAGYAAFANLRPYLPKRKRDCASSPYCDVKNPSL